jgi:hypothetical protein
MYTKYASITLLSCLLALAACDQPSATSDSTGKDDPVITQDDPVITQTDGTGKIQVALLLDTSSSMDGLIEQAKSRLWNIVNTLTTLRYNGEAPVIEIAVYEYGNDGLSPEADYIRQVTSLTTDLDLISEQLFSLRTNGGEEYCGAVIQDAAKKLKWGSAGSGMKLVYIAGNEEFDQGGVHYKEAIGAARRQEIYVNTIFCGDREEGIRSSWKKGAEAGSGKFFTIDPNEEIVHISTPYDERIARCNERINDTYVQYGASGAEKKSNQLMQDANASGISSSTFTDRAVSKSQTAYNNYSWDLVDKAKNEKDALKSLKKNELPAELRRDRALCSKKSRRKRTHSERDWRAR